MTGSGPDLGFPHGKLGWVSSVDIIRQMVEAAPLTAILRNVATLVSSTVKTGGCIVFQRREDRLDVVAAVGLPDGLIEPVENVQRAAVACVSAAAALDCSPVVVEDIGTDPMWSSRRHLALNAGFCKSKSAPFFSSTGAVLGVITAIYAESDGSPKFDFLFQAAVDLASIAVEGENHRKAHADLAFLVRAGEILSSSLDYETTLANVTKAAVPGVADWCSVYMVQDDGTIAQMAISHSNPDKIQVAKDVYRDSPTTTSASHSVGKVVRTGKPVVYPDLPDELLTAIARTPQRLDFLKEMGVTSAMIVPLRVRGKTLGAISFTSAESGRHYGAEDLALAEDLARRAALAVDMARLYKQLIESHSKLESLIHTSPLGIVAVDLDGKITEWSRAAEHVYGWTKEEVLGKPYPAVPPEERASFEAQLDELARTESGIDRVVSRCRKDGLRVHLSIGASALRGPSGEVMGYMAVIADITDRTRFLRLASHELRNPLATIQAISSLMAMQAGESAVFPVKSRHLLTLRREIQRFGNLLEEIFDAFRLQSGHLTFAREHIDLSSVVDAAVHPFQVSDDRHTIIIQGTQSEIPIEGDMRRLEEVVRNLITNALKYSPDGGKVWVDVAHVGTRAIIAVRDEGVGIPTGELPRIFEDFYRASNVIPLDPGGMGLGLYLCSEIVTNHGGRIWCQSQEGEGTTFFVELPVLDGGH